MLLSDALSGLRFYLLEHGLQHLLRWKKEWSVIIKDLWTAFSPRIGVEESRNPALSLYLQFNNS